MTDLERDAMAKRCAEEAQRDMDDEIFKALKVLSDAVKEEMKARGYLVVNGCEGGQA